MDVRLSPEQEALRTSAASVVDKLGPRSVPDLDDSARVARLEAAVDESGWRDLRARGEGGGPVASGVEVAVVAEELGRGLADVSFLGPTLAADLRRRAGASPAGVTETVLLDPTLSSLCVAMDEQSSEGVAVDAGGAASALLLLSHTSPEDHVLVSLPICRAPVQLDLTRIAAVPEASASIQQLGAGTGALGDDDLAAWLALGLAIGCADLVGVMRGATELARAYAGVRRQYDAPIGAFQAVQHMLADAFVALEGSRSVALHAAWAVDALPAQEALAAAALAKVYCARSAKSVCETAVQVHGGIGNTWDCLAHVYLRRALLSSDLFGAEGANIGRVLANHGIRGGQGDGDGVR
ncbi:MAG TPA: acyl-CoA dehydrogenase [Acidimicrobiales bacterium]|nr:acyl-CoA dehydrogenase [Acidimicrobiales bacterium]